MGHVPHGDLKLKSALQSGVGLIQCSFYELAHSFVFDRGSLQELVLNQVVQIQNKLLNLLIAGEAEAREQVAVGTFAVLLIECSHIVRVQQCLIGVGRRVKNEFNLIVVQDVLAHSVLF